jgi:DNA-binding NarL/FixJ family response regulator
MENPLMKITKIMLVEDNAGYRDILCEIIDPQDGMELLCQFGTAEGALRSFQSMATRKIPDLILLDLNLPGMSGLEALPYLKEYMPRADIIVLTQSDRKDDIFAAIAKGANGYLLKSSTAAEIRSAIQNVASGGSSLDPIVTKFILEYIQKNPVKTAPTSILSHRELEVLDLLASGLQKKDIADQLSISITTVADHVRRIYIKLKVPNAPAAIAKAFSLGILPAAK